MFLFKKTMFALASASLFIFAGCSSSDDLNVKVAEIDATIDGVSFNTKRNPQALPVVRQCVLHGQ